MEAGWAVDTVYMVVVALPRTIQVQVPHALGFGCRRRVGCATSLLMSLGSGAACPDESWIGGSLYSIPCPLRDERRVGVLCRAEQLSRLPDHILGWLVVGLLLYHNIPTASTDDTVYRSCSCTVLSTSSCRPNVTHWPLRKRRRRRAMCEGG